MTKFTEEYLRDNFIRLNDVKMGENVRIFSFVNAYGCEIGDETRVGAFVEIQKGVRIGRRCKISSHSFLCEGVTIEDNVFIGHGVTAGVGVHRALYSSSRRRAMIIRWMSAVPSPMSSIGASR